MKRRAQLSRWALLALLAARGASAQIPVRHGSSRVPAPNLSDSTLRKRLGVDAAESWLHAQDPEQRQRGFERLGSVGTAQAIDLLLKAFETGGAARSAKDRLVAVRALSSHASLPAVREFLVRIMVGVGSNPGRSEAIDGLIERAAALALAGAGDDGAVAALGKALRQSGHVAETASDALLAFPPRNLEPIVQGLRSPTRSLANLLAELGDARAIPALREMVRSAPSDVRPAAALALARLGVGETVELARHWLKHESAPDFQLAAARILLEFQTPDASAAVARLLENEPTRASGLELASQHSLPGLTSTLIRGAKSAAPEEQSAWFAALGLAGSREAISFLGGALGARDTSSAAALALALSPTPEAESALEHALQSASTRRGALRASSARQIALERTPSGFSAALRALAAARDPSDRAVFFQANVIAADADAAAWLKRADPDQVRAVARAAYLPGVARALAERLALEPDLGLREALAACLVSLQAAELVPSDVLLALLDARGLAAPLAARALAARDSRALRPKIVALLGSDDALLRAHAALGLGHSQDSSALGLLERAYRFETEPSVRLAIVRALAARREPARLRALRLARALDGSAQVREAASLALAGAVPAPDGSGRQSVWLELRQGAGSDGALTRGALILTASGLAVPAFADPDGVLLLPAVPTGPFELRLAAPTRTDNAAQPRQP